jgi:hypothetical protein
VTVHVEVIGSARPFQLIDRPLDVGMYRVQIVPVAHGLSPHSPSGKQQTKHHRQQQPFLHKSAPSVFFARR